MPISGLPILDMLRTKMHWHQERQRLLAENIALQRTSAGHVASSLGGGPAAFESKRGGSQTRPSGNAVSLEDEMLKVAQNQMDYQAAASLYTKSLGLVKSALGKR
jgi:flagellar basal-body rod protein FlgB